MRRRLQKAIRRNGSQLMSLTVCLWDGFNHPNLPAVVLQQRSRFSVEQLCTPRRWGTEIFRVFVVKYEPSPGPSIIRLERDTKTITQRLPPDPSRLIARLPGSRIACVGNFHPTLDAVYIGCYNIHATAVPSPFRTDAALSRRIGWAGSRGILFCSLFFARHTYAEDPYFRQRF